MGSISILLADDSITIQKVVGIIFGSDDYSLTIVDNGKAAVQKAQEIKPDVLLIDALMPGMSGYEVCEAVRKDASLAAKPLLLLTGSFEPFDEDKARQCGADDHIVKPFESQQIVAKVQELYQLGISRASAPAAAAAVPDAPPAVQSDTAAPVSTDEPFEFEQTAFADPAVFETPSQEVPSAFETAGVEQSSPFEFSPEPAAAFAAPEVTPAPAVEPLRTPDDPWGAFTQQPAGDLSAAQPELLSAPDLDDEQPDVMALLNDDTALQSAPLHENNHIGASWVPVEEQTFEFREEVALAPSAVVEEAVASVDLPEPEPSFAPDAFEPVAPVEPVTEQVAEVPLQVVPAVESAPVQAAVAPAAGAVALSEEQLKAALLSASKETIERIVWEVVPDLAEAMIKEAIKRITEEK